MTVPESVFTAKDPFFSASYPDPRIIRLDKRFPVLGNAALERITTGYRWVEGPVYFGDGGFLLWSDIPNNRIMRWCETDGHISVYRSPSHYANGNTRDRQGRLVTCEHDTRRVTRTEWDGQVTIIADQYDNKKLNAPNDVVVARDGAIWFTDPGYGTEGDYEGHQATHELPYNVYRVDGQSGKIEIIADDFCRPNGLAFAPDETRLYIVDSGITHGGPAHIRCFDVENGRHLKNSRIFADHFAPGTSDGVRTDITGNIWCTVAGAGAEENGIRCYAADGDLIGKIHVPEGCGNLCFGGIKKNRLFIAASTSIYSIFVNTKGAQTP